ncbi:Melanopsin [Mactra antiquata]
MNDSTEYSMAGNVVTTELTPYSTYTDDIWTPDGTTIQNEYLTNQPDTQTHIFDTYSVFIHPHWRNFPMVADAWHYFIGVYITCVGITGILGNSLVIWIFSREKPLRTSSNMFIINLAISDLTFSIVNGFPLLTLSAFSKKWIFGQAACEFYGLIGGIFGLMSINTMATIAIDRYFAIARPLHVAKFMTRRRAFLMIAVVWLWSFASSLPPIFGWGRYIPEGFQTSCTFDYLTRTDNNRSYIFFMYIFGFAVPLAIIFVSYGLIVKAVRDHEKEMKKTAKKLNAEMRSNQDKKKMEIKVAKISVCILFLYLLSWTPYATVALIGQFGDAMFVTPFWSEIPVMFAKASAMHNPLVYALSHPKFRAAVHKRFPFLCCCQPEEKVFSTTGTHRDRATSRRSVSSVTGAHSIDSQISDVSDHDRTDIEIRLRKINHQNTSPDNVDIKFAPEKHDDIASNKIIQNFTNALREVASRDNSAEQTKVVAGFLKNKLDKDINKDDGVFVLSKSMIPELANYLSKCSDILKEEETGFTNLAMDISPDVPSTSHDDNNIKTADT